jgi:hypothetical protein
MIKDRQTPKSSIHNKNQIPKHSQPTQILKTLHNFFLVSNSISQTLLRYNHPQNQDI